MFSDRGGGIGTIFDQYLDPSAIAPDRRIQIDFVTIRRGLMTQIKLITT